MFVWMIIILIQEAFSYSHYAMWIYSSYINILLLDSKWVNDYTNIFGDQYDGNSDKLFC